ncbi:hypothetical protein [Defluviimonas sp. SAOS-178_SWC]|uniref:hypothetical protein n=1 Tax=Defluviimonas sp. SAOS-178_SWC TaxID=3121287 RepID=UPI0032218CFE
MTGGRKLVGVFGRDMVDLSPRGISAETFARMPEAARLATIKASAAVPSACGPDIGPAPARGAFGVFRPVEIVPGSAGTARPAGYRGPGEVLHRSAIKRADVFDAMRNDARLRHERDTGTAAGFIPPFSPGQEQVARDYRDLTERHGSAGYKCASLEALHTGSASGGEFIDAYVAEGIRLKALIARIGAGAALEVRRLRPSKRGTTARGVILDRTLVDMVCLGDRSLSDVLRHHGWAAKGDTREALRRALAAALDRMRGYDLRRTQNLA